MIESKLQIFKKNSIIKRFIYYLNPKVFFYLFPDDARLQNTRSKYKRCLEIIAFKYLLRIIIILICVENFIDSEESEF